MYQPKTRNQLHEHGGSVILSLLWLFSAFIAWVPITPPGVGELFGLICTLIVVYVCIETVVLALFGNRINLPTQRLTREMRAGFFFVNFLCIVLTMIDGRLIEGIIALVALFLHEMLETRAYRIEREMQDG